MLRVIRKRAVRIIKANVQVLNTILTQTSTPLGSCLVGDMLLQTRPRRLMQQSGAASRQQRHVKHGPVVSTLLHDAPKDFIVNWNQVNSVAKDLSSEVPGHVYALYAVKIVARFTSYRAST